MTGSVVAYLRISSDRDGLELGVQRQREDCEELARRLGYDDVEYIVENDTGASTRSRKKRPKFEDMMRRVEAGDVSIILAYSNSRLTRRPAEFEDLIKVHEKTGVRFFTVVSGNDDLGTADGRMIARIKASVDAGESERSGERVSRAAQQRAQSGIWHGGPAPFGYCVTQDGPTGKNVLQVHEPHAAMLREAADRLLAGDTLYGICNSWNEQGLTTSRGAHWRSKTLRSALLSLAVVGKTKVGVRGWEPVLENDTWEQVGAMLRNPSRTFPLPATGHTAKRTMGGGLTVCGICGKSMVSQVHRGVPRLICHKQATGGCGRMTVQHEMLERYVAEQVFAALETETTQNLLAATDDEAASDVRRSIRARVQELDAKTTRAYDAYTDGLVSRAEFAAQREVVEKERVDLDRRLAEVASSGIVGSLDQIRDGWDQRPPLARRSVLSAIVREVRVYPFPEGVASRLTPFRGESDDDYAARRLAHQDQVLDQRLKIVWRV